MYNFLGVSSNLSVLAGTRWQSTLRFRDGVTGEAAALDGVTFEGAVHCDGTDYAIELTLSEADAERNTVLMAIPGLPEGRWEWELWLRSETGHVVRLVEGRVSALGKLVDDTDVFAHRTLDVLLPGDVAKRVQVEWQASTVAVQAMQESLRVAEGLKDLKEDAEDAIERAQDALDKLGTVDELVEDAEQAAADAAASKEGAEAVLESAKELIAEAPREFIPTISEDGYWCINGEKTPHKALGEDGADGTQLRRVLLEGAHQLPEGEDPGVLYYTMRTGWERFGPADAPNDTEWNGLMFAAELLPGAFNAVRVPDVLKANGTAVYMMVRATMNGVTRVLGVSRNAVSWAVGDDVVWYFDELMSAPAGATVGLWLMLTNAGTTGDVPVPDVNIKTLFGEGVSEWRYYDGWNSGKLPQFEMMTCTGYDLWQWFEGYGWMCTGGEDELVVGPADEQRYGLVKLGTNASGPGAPVGLNERNQLTVPTATTLSYGSVMLSYQGVLADGLLIGMDAQGRVVAEGTNVAPAQAFRWGTVKVGSSLPMSMGMPWIIPVGMAMTGVRNEYGQDITGQLLNNVVPDGALRTHVKADWVARGTAGCARLPDGTNAVGIATSSSFEQNAEQGLMLNHATTTQVGGVTLTNSPLDPAAAHVLDAGALNQFYPLRTDVREWLKSYIETNATMMSIQVMSQAEYDALPSVKAQTLYIVY